MCRCLSVSRSGFYAWRTRKPSARATENAALTEEIKEVFQTSRYKYGSPRVYDELVDRGHEINIKRVARIMCEEGLVGRQKRKFVKTTDSDHGDPIADNLLQREFDVDKPDVAWVGDGVAPIWWTGLVATQQSIHIRLGRRSQGRNGDVCRCSNFRCSW